MTAHPILEELSRQLPESAHTVQLIQESAQFEKITVQAQSDIACLENLEGHLKDGRSAKTVQTWLAASDQDERLRVLGALKLIADVPEDLAED